MVKTVTSIANGHNPNCFGIDLNKKRRTEMSEYNIYADIASRTGGDVYIGVVGPVRTGN